MDTLREYVKKDRTQREYQQRARRYALETALYAAVQRTTETMIMACGYARALYGDDGDRRVTQIVADALANWQERQGNG